VIGQEAGCYITGGHNSPRDGDVTPEILLGRKYFIVRAIADSEVRSGSRCPLRYLIRRQTEKGSDAQKRIAEEFYATVIDTAPN
jgi:myo-inositol-1(or 4)-monophosphatase